MFNLKQGLSKVSRSVAIFAIPVAIAYLSTTGLGGRKVIDIIVEACPLLGSLTVSGVLLLLRDYLRHKK